MSDEVIKRNKFCSGVRVGHKYACGGEVNDVELLNESVNLLTEAVNRILKWQVWDTWWIDVWRREWNRVRDNVKEQFKGKYSDEVMNNLLVVIDEYIRYIDVLKEYWVTNDVGGNIRKLVEDLMSERAEVIVRRTGNSLINSVHGKYVSLTAKRPGEGVIVHLELSDLRVMTVKVPDIWNIINVDHDESIKDVLMALRLALPPLMRV